MSRPVASLLALLLLAAPAARADLVNPSWSYQWAPSPVVVHADTPGPGTVTLTTFPGSGSAPVGQAQAALVAYVNYSSTAPAATPDHFTNQSFSLALTLKDVASGQSGVLNFTGSFNGTLSATGGQLSATFSGSMSNSLHLGNYNYSVTMSPYVPPPDASGRFPGLFLASIAAQAPQKLPEPGSLVLAGAGAVLLTLSSRRRPRRPA
jgi:hypothetical protein